MFLLKVLDRRDRIYRENKFTFSGPERLQTAFEHERMNFLVWPHCNPRNFFEALRLESAEETLDEVKVTLKGTKNEFVKKNRISTTTYIDLLLNAESVVLGFVPAHDSAHFRPLMRSETFSP